MTKKMIVNALDPEEVRIAVLEDARLEEFDIETRGLEKNKGNIYKAKVVAVEPALNAAFIDYGADKQGFLTAGDVDRKLASKPPPADRAPTIADLLRPGMEILVQITKDEVGAKGAVLTTFLSLAGRYVVLQPDSETQAISRKVDDEESRQQMRELVAKLEVPGGMGVILRTAGKDRTKVELMRDLRVLLRLWDNIKKQAKNAKTPSLIFKEQDVIIRHLRDYFTTDIDEVVLDSDEAFDRAAEYMDLVMPKFRQVLTRYVERRPIFHHYRIEEQLEELYTPRVNLPSGGSVVIEPTEALVAIDVNSGKQKMGGHEETATQTNIEAAREVARQLRLRDLGGIIVIDFIDMFQRKNQQKVERALREALRYDKARVKLSRISRNGTLELTRQRIRSELAASVFRTCMVCHGTGRILNPASHAVSVLRKLRDRAARGDLTAATVRVEPEAANHLKTEKWNDVQDVEQRYSVRIEIIADRSLSPGLDDFTFETDPNAQVHVPEEPNFGPAEIPEEVREELRAEAAALEEGLAEGEEGEESEAESIGDAAVRKRRRRRRKRPAEAEGNGKAEGARLGMPSFELIDPADLDLKPKRERRRPERDEGEVRNGKRRRGRRGGRRRKPAAETTAAPPAVAKRAAPPTETKPKKRGFLGWLFGTGE